MTIPSFRDMEQISAFLDGQLSQAEKTRLEARLRSDPALAVELAGLRQTRSILRRMPKRRLPRNFTLTPKMAGVRPPLPRAVPALGWASGMAMLLAVFSLGTNLLARISFGAAAPMMAAAPMTSEGSGFGGGPADTQSPDIAGSQATPTAENFVMTGPEVTPPGGTRLVSPETATKTTPELVNIWPYIWLVLAAVLIAAALLIRRASIQAFRRKVGTKRNT
jgi:anti-sigma factor RsiW